MTIYENVKNNRQYSANTGCTQKEFETLHKTFEKWYQPKKDLPYTPETKQPLLKDSKEALFFVLFYLKTGLPYQVIGTCFSMSDTSVMNHLKRIKPVLKSTLQELKLLPKGLFETQADLDKAFENVEDLILDCTEIPVQRAENQEVQKEFYSGKKNNIL